MIWVHVGNGQRGTYELFLMLTLSTLAIRSYRRHLQVPIVLFWCAAGGYTFFGAFDAELIRAAVFPAL
jgi:hypothetical protein